jgi:hypothetical protein
MVSHYGWRRSARGTPRPLGMGPSSCGFPLKQPLYLAGWNINPAWISQNAVIYPGKIGVYVTMYPS